ncbi:MAG TPA: FABP family protein [Actinomycetota bacterium]|nr:FABP family protein [Actinomycetota bacterium]
MKKRGEIQIHPLVEPLAYLLGTWRGEGRGHYPSIDDFSYSEESSWDHDGRPFLYYRQNTWNLATGAPSHSEAGFWRVKDGGRIELVIAHNNGVVEVQSGTFKGTRIEVASTELSSAPTAMTIGGLARVFEVVGDSLSYELAMAFDEHASQNHLTATLQRQSG